MSRPKTKNNYIHPIVVMRIKHLCYGSLRDFYYRHLFEKVSFDSARFIQMMKPEASCTAKEEASLYVRLAAIEREIRETYAAYDLIDEGQVQWAVGHLAVAHA